MSSHTQGGERRNKTKFWSNWIISNWFQLSCLLLSLTPYGIWVWEEGILCSQIPQALMTLQFLRQCPLVWSLLALLSLMAEVSSRWDMWLYFSILSCPAWLTQGLLHPTSDSDLRGLCSGSLFRLPWRSMQTLWLPMQWPYKPPLEGLWECLGPRHAKRKLKMAQKR